MSVFYFIGVYFLGIIFAGAWLDKVRKQTAHMQQMNAYRSRLRSRRQCFICF